MYIPAAGATLLILLLLLRVWSLLVFGPRRLCLADSEASAEEKTRTRFDAGPSLVPCIRHCSVETERIKERELKTRIPQGVTRGPEKQKGLAGASLFNSRFKNAKEHWCIERFCVMCWFCLGSHPWGQILLQMCVHTFPGPEQAPTAPWVTIVA